MTMKEFKIVAYNEMEDIFIYIKDIYYFLDYMPKIEYYKDISDIHQRVNLLRAKCINEMNTPLIALKNYTEGKCSWERAGMMCDLHIWGLRKYCTEKNVDYTNLRIDEYYGIKGEKGIQKIKKEWEKLDPLNELQPIDYNGKSLYTKYPHLKDISINERGYNDANENYIKYKSKMLISKYACELYKTINKLIEKNPEYEKEVIVYRTKHINKEISKICEGINITNEEDLNFLMSVLLSCYNSLEDSKSMNSLDKILESFDKLKNILIDEYYYYTINQDKKTNEEKD